jgi:dynein heavy chain, axonemal
LSTILNVQPRVIAGAGGKSSEDIILELAIELEANLPPLLDKEDHAKEIFKLTNKGLLSCLSTVLLQEIERYNKLLFKMGSSLSLLMKAIKGIVIMSPELDLMFSAFLKN